MVAEWFQKGIPFFAYGREDLGCTPFSSQLDLYVQHEFRLASRYRLQVNMNMFNVFDQNVETGVWYNPYRESLNLPDEQFFDGFDARALSADLQPDARFGLASAYQAPRSVVLGMKVLF